MTKQKQVYKVNDYILDFLVSQGVREVFVVTGGAIAFVMDAFYGRKDIKYVPVNHEQGAAMMGEAYSRLGPGLSACMVTSGPGATNLITGMGCAWFDSIPTLYISGQVNTYEQKGGMPGTENSRQIGFQETDIVSIVKPLTKYVVKIGKLEDVRYELEKAVYMAKSGRPGPVLVDIPMDLQRVPCEPKRMKSFATPTTLPYRDTGSKLREKVKQAWEILVKAERPVLLSGGGIRLADGIREVHQLTKLTKFPVVTSWSGLDSFGWEHQQLIGCHGVYGTRAANFTVQNADAILSVGSRLDTRQTGGRPETFARLAQIIMVDIDQGELAKRRGLTPKLEIECDAKEFLREMIKQAPKYLKRLPNTKAWLARTLAWKKKYPTVQKIHFKQKKYVNPYVFGEMLSQELKKDAVIIPDDGGHLTWIMQSFKLKQGQRLFSAFGNSPMGYAFPAAIGASVALGKKEVICIDGDGSFQMNVQELQTLSIQKLPVKIFILDNRGYGIIKQFQELYLDNHYIATDATTGVCNPDFIKLAKVYGIPGKMINNHQKLKRGIRWALAQKGPCLVQVMLKPDQKIEPKLTFGNPIEDLSPLLPRDEFNANMIIPTVDRDKTLTESN
ncbi:MAG: thiamine pyrophosphate-binding protein [bacterium]